MADKTKKKTRDINQRVADIANLPNRSMPESLEAEAAVLGAMIINPQCISEVVEQLKADSFYRPEHQIIFDAVIALYEKNRAGVIDGVLLRDELKKRKQLDEVGGAEYLARIMESVPSAANIDYYLSIVRDKMLLREIIVSAGEIINEAYDPIGDADEKLDEAERKIFEITEKKISESAVMLKDIIIYVNELIENREGTHVTGLATGYYELDDITCGLQNGEMIIIAGRPSMGKTSFALNIVEHIGVEGRIPVAVFSLEMSRQQLAERLLCSRSRIESQLVRKGMLREEHHPKLQNVSGELYDAPIYVDDTASLTPLEFRAKARRLKSRFDIRCIVVDYLQLMHLGSSRVESRQQEITTISRHLKSLARELNIPVVVLSQLNRSAEGREDNRPRMSDLRESGSIEQDADVVMLLHREDYYNRQKQGKDFQPTNTAELIIAKQRNGPTGAVGLIFLDKYTRFENASHIEERTGQFESSSEKAVPF